jgi:Uncharacterised nucleotidyltransferase
MSSTPADPQQHPLSSAAVAFYRGSMAALEQQAIPFMVGGAYAFAHYTGIVRHTKDFDLFIHPRDLEGALATLAAAGYPVERNFPHWLGKARCGDHYVDLIYGSGNGLTPVDDEWFIHSRPAEVMGMPVRLCPPEEMLWSKAFIMERERFDGADVAHLLHGCAEELDWQRLLRRFGEHWRVLLSHLILFGYIYPAATARIPAPVTANLVKRLHRDSDDPDAAVEALCRGTVLSRAQYLFDLENHGYRDARLAPRGNMSREDVAQWTAAIEEDAQAPDLKGADCAAGPRDR